MTTLCALLGRTNYYRRFVRDFAKIATPLTDLLRSKEFTWSDQAHSAFLALKQKMEHLVTLALPNFNAEFDVTTDNDSSINKTIVPLHSLVRNYVPQ